MKQTRKWLATVVIVTGSLLFWLACGGGGGSGGGGGGSAGTVTGTIEDPSSVIASISPEKAISIPSLAVSVTLDSESIGECTVATDLSYSCDLSALPAVGDVLIVSVGGLLESRCTVASVEGNAIDCGETNLATSLAHWGVQYAEENVDASISPALSAEDAATYYALYVSVLAHLSIIDTSSLALDNPRMMQELHDAVQAFVEGGDASLITEDESIQGLFRFIAQQVESFSELSDEQKQEVLAAILSIPADTVIDPTYLSYLLAIAGDVNVDIPLAIFGAGMIADFAFEVFGVSAVELYATLEQAGLEDDTLDQVFASVLRGMRFASDDVDLSQAISTDILSFWRIHGMSFGYLLFFAYTDVLMGGDIPEAALTDAMLRGASDMARCTYEMSDLSEVSNLFSQDGGGEPEMQNIGVMPSMSKYKENVVDILMDQDNMNALLAAGGNDLLSCFSGCSAKGDLDENSEMLVCSMGFVFTAVTREGQLAQFADAFGGGGGSGDADGGLDYDFFEQVTVGGWEVDESHGDCNMIGAPLGALSSNMMSYWAPESGDVEIVNIEYWNNEEQNNGSPFLDGETTHQHESYQAPTSGRLKLYGWSDGDHGADSNTYGCTVRTYGVDADARLKFECVFQDPNGMGGADITCVKLYQPGGGGD